MGIFTRNTIKITPNGCRRLPAGAYFATRRSGRRTKVLHRGVDRPGLSPRFPCRTGKTREKIESGRGADPASSEKTHPDLILTRPFVVFTAASSSEVIFPAMRLSREMAGKCK